jgi:hypothetical protein
MTYDVALVSDRAGSFATVLARPAPRAVEGGRILITTLATFDHEDEALAFLRELQGVDAQKRKRMPSEIEALERHGLVPVLPPGPA